MSVDRGIVLKKSFWGDERKFLEPRFARGDMRDHTVSHRIDHGASYRRYGVLPRRSRLKIKPCEIFGVVRFSNATLSGAKRTSRLTHRGTLLGAKQVCLCQHSKNLPITLTDRPFQQRIRRTSTSIGNA